MIRTRTRTGQTGRGGPASGRAAGLRLGSARANVALGRPGNAAERYRQLSEVWHEADAGHAGLDEARRFLSELSTRTAGRS